VSKTAEYNLVATVPQQVAANPGPQPKTFLISVETGGPVTLGGSDVTPGEGVTLTSAQPALSIQLNGDDLWAVTDTGISADVAVVTTISGLEA